MRNDATTSALEAPDEASRFRRLHALLVAIVTLAVLAPFLGKAYHIDDPMYLWAAQHIREHPLDFYGFDVNWYGFVLPMHEVMQNPPLSSYFMALASHLVEWKEVGQHAYFMLWALAWTLGMYTLACRVCTRPLLATLITMVSPVFLVCATSIMCDIPMSCLWLWAIVLWDDGLRRERWTSLLAAAMLIAASAMTKYFGAALVPLLLVYSVFCKRRIGLWALWLLVPVAAIAGYERWTHSLYGHGIFSSAFQYADDMRTILPQGRSTLIKGLAFTGGCLLPAMFFAPLMWSRTALALGLVATAGLAWAATQLRSWSVLQFSTDSGVDWPLAMQTAALIITGASVLAAAAIDLWRRRDACSVMLAAWVFGTFVFAACLNWSVTARTILPMTPAVAMLIVRRIEDREAIAAKTRTIAVASVAPRATWRWAWCLTPSALMALAAAVSDFELARVSREAAIRVADMPRSSVVTLWFMGHWGWQHYLEERGGKALDFDRRDMLPGDVIAIATYNCNVIAPPAADVERREVLEIPTLPWLTIFHPLVGAGFHSSEFGPIPMFVGRVPPERFEVFVAKRTFDISIPAPRAAANR